jgi:hypothetical protein
VSNNGDEVDGLVLVAHDHFVGFAFGARE